VARSTQVCVQRFGAPREMLRGAAWCLIGLALLGALMSLLAIVVAGLLSVLAFPLALAAFGLLIVGIFCAVVAPLYWLSAHMARFHPGTLRVEDGLVLTVDRNEMVFPLVLVTGAKMSPEGDELALATRDGDVIRARVRGVDEGRAIVEALAVSKVHGTWLASLHRREAPARWVQSPWLSALGAAAIAFLVTLPFLRDTASLLAALTAFAAVRVGADWARKPDVIGSIVVGNDGIALKQGAGDRFIAFGSIERVDETTAGARLLLKSGESVDVDILPIPPPAAKTKAKTEATTETEAEGSLTAELAARRRAELNALLRRGLLPDGPEIVRAGALLERRRRTVRAWREALATLVREAAGDYRTASLPREQALAVLEDGHASGELRIGAALALTAGGSRVAGQHSAPRGLDDETRLRLRIAVETCVNQDVRTALRDAIYGELEEETLDRAINPVRTAR
jgi:hypothetical protein